MKINPNHPSFVAFLDNVTNTVFSKIEVSNYFNLSQDSKFKITFTVLTMLKNSSKLKATVTDTELKVFLSILRNKNEEKENYEIAAILSDTLKNFDRIMEVSNLTKKPVKAKTTTRR